MSFNPDEWLQILVALACGAAVGLERQLRGKPAGIRTCALVATGAAAFMVLAGNDNAAPADMDRVLGQLVVGVGFLGGGVMINRGPEVSGLTTASVIWLLAAVGAAAGMGRFEISVGLTAIVLTLLVGIGVLEAKVASFRKGAHRSQSD